MYQKIIENDVFALATDTIWGLACRADRQDLVHKLFMLKQRDPNKSIVLFTSTIEKAQSLITIPCVLGGVIKNFWPGAFTLVSTPKDDHFSYCHPFTPGLGVRIPNHPLCLEILSSLPFPLAVTSCNLSGHPPMVTREEICKCFENIPVIGEDIPLNSPPSIVVEWKEDRLFILRATEEQKKIVTVQASYAFYPSFTQKPL